MEVFFLMQKLLDLIKDTKVGALPLFLVAFMFCVVIAASVFVAVDSGRVKKKQNLEKECVHFFLEKKWSFSDAKGYCTEYLKDWDKKRKNKKKKNAKTRK